jgi:hypothetical protein
VVLVVVVLVVVVAGSTVLSKNRLPVSQEMAVGGAEVTFAIDLGRECDVSEVGYTYTPYVCDAHLSFILLLLVSQRHSAFVYQNGLPQSVSQFASIQILKRSSVQACAAGCQRLHAMPDVCIRLSSVFSL